MVAIGLRFTVPTRTTRTKAFSRGKQGVDNWPSRNKYVLMTLSSKQELVIDMLRHGRMYGLDMIKKSGGNLKRGSVYLTLSAMEAEGLIEGETVPSEPPLMPRRLYRVTENGLQTFLRRHAAPLPMAIAVSV